jgi:hypothetical protein
MIHTTSKSLAATRLLASAAPLALMAAATPALADTSVSTATTAPLVTSTAGSVTVTGSGSITVPSGTGVTVDSNNTVTVNSGGAIKMGDANGATGVAVNPGVTTTIANAGTISVLETFSAADADSNGIADGPVASASNRYGIRLLPGGTVTGSVSNTGTISVEGLNSAGISNEGVLTGDLSNTGTIGVKGDNSVAIRTGTVGGNVVANGTVTVVGQGAQALVVDGNVTGQVKIGGDLAQSSSYTTDAGATQALSRSALQSGKAAVEIDGNVGGGVLVYVPSSSSATDQSTGSITAYGNSPGMQIGGATDITIGGGTTNVGTYSLGIDGSVSANAVYSSTNAFGVVIGGKGGNVTLTKGIAVSGSVSATTVDSAATALLINAGSTVGTVYNSGSIKSVISSPGIGASYAIRDLSGTVTTLENAGSISVSGSSEDTLAAIDLSANTSGVTIKQTLTAANATAQSNDKAASGYDPDTAKSYSTITGDIYTGTGNDLLDIQTGKVTGNAYLGAGDDIVKLGDDAKWIGNIDYGTGAATLTMAGNSRFTGTMILNGQAGTLTLADNSRWLGTVTGGSQLAVTVNGGTFGANAATTTTIGSLNVGANGTLRVYVDGAAGTSSRLIADTATFASGAKVSATVSSLSKAEGTFTVLSAGTLTGAATIDASQLNMPVLYNGTLAAVGNDLQLTIARKTAAQLGLNGAQSAAYSAIIANALENTGLQTSLLQVADTATLQGQFAQMLPEYSGGTFDIITRGARLAARHIDDDSSIYTISDVGGWLEPFYFRGEHSAGADAGFKDSGGGLSLGIERKTGLGRFGASFTYFSGTVKTGDYQRVKASDIELGLFWRLAKGPFYAWARGGLGKQKYTSTRNFIGAADGATLAYAAQGKWKGWSASGTGGISYALAIGEHLKFKPKGVLEYFRLHENDYQETGSAPIILGVDSRNSEALNGTATLAASWSAGQGDYENRPFTVELEGGRRSRLSGHLGATTATFGSGDSFTIQPASLPSAWVGNLSVYAGGLDYTWKLSTGAERMQGGGTSYSVRASLSIAM